MSKNSLLFCCVSGKKKIVAYELPIFIFYLVRVQFTKLEFISSYILRCFTVYRPHCG